MPEGAATLHPEPGLAAGATAGGAAAAVGIGPQPAGCCGEVPAPVPVAEPADDEGPHPQPPAICPRAPMEPCIRSEVICIMRLGLKASKEKTLNIRSTIPRWSRSPAWNALLQALPNWP